MTDQTSHVTSKPNSKPTGLDIIKGQMNNALYKNQILNYFNRNEDEAMKFLSASVEYIRRVPKLLETNPDSLLGALVTAAQFRFMPSGVMGEAYIIPYGKEANFQLGYQGIITLLWRTKQIKSLKAIVVFTNDEFSYEEGLDTKLIHKPTKFGDEPGDPIGVYAVAETINDGYVFKVMSKAQVMAIKGMSKAKDSKASPWNSKDPEKWMWKKTCLIQLAKLLPKSQEIQKAIEEDYKGEGSDKPILDAGGPAVGAAIHAPSVNKDQTHDEPNSERGAQTVGDTNAG